MGVYDNIDLSVNPLSDDKILGFPKLKAFADDKLNVAQNVKVGFHRIENIVGKEENSGYQHFLLFPQCFQKFLFFSLQCVKICHWVVKGFNITSTYICTFYTHTHTHTHTHKKIYLCSTYRINNFKCSKVFTR